jgi:hypothetical protein
VSVAKKGSRFEKGRRPHNASKTQEFADVGELFRNLAAEKKRVTINGEQVEMSWAERSFRVTIDRAISGKRQDLAHLLRLMIKYPGIAGPGRGITQIFLGGLA